MAVKKRPLPDGRPVSQGFDGYECTACGAHSYNSVKMNHKPDCTMESIETAQARANSQPQT